MEPNIELLDIIEYEDRIEILYKEIPNIWPSVIKVYKIIYSCKDGKWNKSDKIYGTLVPAVDEHYEFND